MTHPSMSWVLLLTPGLNSSRTLLKLRKESRCKELYLSGLTMEAMDGDRVDQLVSALDVPRNRYPPRGMKASWFW